MLERRYRTAYVISKVGEVLGWLVVIGGIIGAIASGAEIDNPRTGYLGAMFLVFSGLAFVSGLILVFLAQLTLIFIDTENNTRSLAAVAGKTNAMIADTIGSIAANLEKLAGKKG